MGDRGYPTSGNPIVVRINPHVGVTCCINLADFSARTGALSQAIPAVDVLNGIAYDDRPASLVTGNWWPRIYQVASDKHPIIGRSSGRLFPRRNRSAAVWVIFSRATEPHDQRASDDPVAPTMLTVGVLARSSTPQARTRSEIADRLLPARRLELQPARQYTCAIWVACHATHDSHVGGVARSSPEGKGSRWDRQTNVDTNYQWVRCCGASAP